MERRIASNVLLRTFAAADAPALARHANNRKIWENLRDAFPHPYRLEDAEAFIARAHDTTFCIEVDGEAAGGIGLHPRQDIERFNAELGYWVAEPHWGRGIMGAAVQAVTAHGFEALGLRRILAMPFSFNVGSCRVLERAGYVLEAVLRDHVFKDGRFLDQFMYAKVAGRDPAPPRHALTILAVPDLDAASRFYEAALGWPRTVHTERYVELEHPDGQRLGLYDRAGFAANTGAPPPASAAAPATTATELYFSVADLDAAIARVRAAGARLLAARAPKPWGDEAAYYADPYGNVVVLARRSRKL